MVVIIYSFLEVAFGLVGTVLYLKLILIGSSSACLSYCMADISSGSR